MDRRSVLAGLGAMGVAGCSVGDMMNWSKEIEALEARHGGLLGVAVSTTGRSMAYNPDHRFVYCSTFKAYLAAATLLRVQAGDERLDRAIPVTAADMLPNAPVSQPAVGGTLTIEQLVKGAVEVSDNPAANILIRELGGLDAMRAFYRGIGDQITTVDRMETGLNRIDGDKDTTSPAQSVANLHKLFVDTHSPLDAESRKRLLGWMVASPTGAGRIKAGLPADWRVAHKTGTGGYGPTNDIGVVYSPSGDPICIAVYFQATASSTAAQRDAVIADATRASLKALGYDVPA